MPKYQRKPIVVEAEKYKKGLEDGFKIREIHTSNSSPFFVTNEKLEKLHANFYEKISPAIKTSHGWVEVSEDDYIIFGIEGEKYPCKPHIFEKTYELYDKAPPPPKEALEAKVIRKS